VSTIYARFNELPRGYTAIKEAGLFIANNPASKEEREKIWEREEIASTGPLNEQILYQPKMTGI